MKSVRGQKNRAPGIPETPPKAGLFLAKYRLKIALENDRRASIKHCVVLGLLLEKYLDEHNGQRYEDALVSVRTIVTEVDARNKDHPYGAKLSRSSAQRILADLMSWRYVIRTEVGVRRIGKNHGSRWVPNWALVWPELNYLSHSWRDTFICPTQGGTGCPTQSGTDNAESVPPIHGTKDPLTSPGYEPVTSKREIDSAAAAGGGLSASAEAAPPAAGKDGFEAIVEAYGPERAGQASAARKAYAALAPDTNLAAVVKSAAEWRQAWLAQGNPDAPRKTLVKWLEVGCYNQEPPGRKFNKPSSEAANDNRPPLGRHEAVITDTDAFTPPGKRGDHFVIMFRTTDTGAEFEDTFPLDEDGEVCGDDRKRYLKLLAAAGVTDEFNASTLLVNAVLDVERTRYGIRYHDAA